MNTLQGIPVQVEYDPTAADRLIAGSILHELHALLERLLAEGEGGTIDLRGLPALNPSSLAILEQALSLGEVDAVIRGVGQTEIRETAYPGIWWVVHRNDRGDIVTEMIEVSHVPDLLKSPREDIAVGLHRLRQSLSSLEPAPGKDATGEVVTL